MARSISETIEAVLKAAPVEKVTTTAPRAEGATPLAKLANLLREAPKPVLTYPILHVVKNAMVNGSLEEIPLPTFPEPTGTPEVKSLRKLANALREEDIQEQNNLLKSGSHTLRAARGLMLLRELVRG